jgi:hypothetical protein
MHQLKTMKIMMKLIENTTIEMNSKRGRPRGASPGSGQPDLLGATGVTPGGSAVLSPHIFLRRGLSSKKANYIPKRPAVSRCTTN